MSRRAALVLRLSVVFAVWVWVVLIRNMIVGNFAWSFKLVHIVLAVVSLAFAVATWRITTTSRRFTREVERERSPRGERLSTAQLAVGAVRLGLRKRAAAAGGARAAGGAPPPGATGPEVPATSLPGDASG